MLEVLPRLSCLQHLDLGYSLQEAPSDNEKFSALVSSTCLTHLVLDKCKMPPGSFQHIISSFHQQSAMKSLHLSHIIYDKSEGGWLSLSERDLEGLVSRWPALQELRLVNACTSKQLTSLQKLGQLTKLIIGGVGVGQQAVQDLQHIITLQDLHLLAVADVSSATLLRLREHLTSLTRLSISGCSWRQYLPGVIGICCKVRIDHEIASCSLSASEYPSNPPASWKYMCTGLRSPLKEPLLKKLLANLNGLKGNILLDYCTQEQLCFTCH